MNEIIIVKLIVGGVLFAAWMLLEYKPPTATDVDGLKTFIKMTLGALAGNLATPGA